jgi:hypothetical protein
MSRRVQPPFDSWLSTIVDNRLFALQPSCVLARWKQQTDNPILVNHAGFGAGVLATCRMHLSTHQAMCCQVRVLQRKAVDVW